MQHRLKHAHVAVQPQVCYPSKLISTITISDTGLSYVIQPWLIMLRVKASKTEQVHYLVLVACPALSGFSEPEEHESD